ncbi:MAG: hypothetical protein MUF54_08225 [Polyangiaceae bacterium]|jgi:hypothetical protein|nr:hypothetical protein [Polyangiaceae bacterium]
MTMQEEVAKLTPEEQEATMVYQSLVQRLGEKIAKVLAPPGTIGVKWEHGAAFIDEQAPAVVEDIMRRFRGTMALTEFIAFCSSMAGYQAGVARAKGYELPDEVFAESGRIFSAGMRLIAIATEQIMRGGAVQMVPGLRLADKEPK